MHSILYTKAVGKVVEDAEKELKVETPEENEASASILANVKRKVKGEVQKTLFPVGEDF